MWGFEVMYILIVILISSTNFATTFETTQFKLSTPKACETIANYYKSINDLKGVYHISECMIDKPVLDISTKS